MNDSAPHWTLFATLGSLVALAACSAPPEADGPPAFQGFNGSNAGAGASQFDGSSAGGSGAAPDGQVGSGNVGNASGGNASGGSEGFDGQTPFDQNAGGSGGSGSQNANNQNDGSQNGGAGGTASTGGDGGAMGMAGSSFTGGAGADMGGPGGDDGSDPNPGDPGDDGTTDPDPPAGPDIDCPADASFCSGFEGNTLPAGAAFEPAYENFAFGNQASLDTAVTRFGNQSVSFGSNGGYSYRMFAVPVPGQTFWVRLYMRTDSDFGDNSHDTPFLGSRLPVGEYNGDNAVEFSEQGNQVLLNRNDQLFSANGPGFPQGGGPSLPGNTWICMEALFDGASGNVEIYANGDQLINAPGFSPGAYQTFRFGYLSFNDPRTVWYDNVIVAASRVGCD